MKSNNHSIETLRSKLSKININEKNVYVFALINFIVGIIFLFYQIYFLVSCLILIISGLILLWEKTRLKMICDPVVNIQEYPDYYGISPMAVIDGKEIEGLFSITIIKKSLLPLVIYNIEVTLPLHFEMNISQGSYSIITNTTEISGTTSNRKIFEICDELEVVNVTEIRFTINIDKSHTFSNNIFDCPISLNYKMKWLHIHCKETMSFKINT